MILSSDSNTSIKVRISKYFVIILQITDGISPENFPLTKATLNTFKFIYGL